MINQISNNQVSSQYANPIQFESLAKMPNFPGFSNPNQIKDCLYRPNPNPMQRMIDSMMQMMERMMSMLGNLISGLFSKLGMGNGQPSIMPLNGSRSDLGGMAELYGGSSSTGQSSGGIFGGLLKNLGGVGDLVGSFFGSGKDSSEKTGGLLGGFGSFLTKGIGSWLGKIF